MNNSVIVYVDYGNIYFNIKDIMQKKNLSKNQVAKKTGLHHQIIERYYNGTVTRYDKDILAKFCFIFDCKLEDIMFYVKQKK